MIISFNLKRLTDKHNRRYCVKCSDGKITRTIKYMLTHNFMYFFDEYKNAKDLMIEYLDNLMGK